MLLLTRKVGEAIILDGGIKVIVSEVQGNHIRIGVEAPKDVIINREEIHNNIQQEKLKA